MTKKDFELVAATLRDSGVNAGSVERIALLLASQFELAYPRFDRARFMKAVRA